MLDEWLRRRALSNLQSGASRTYVLCPNGSERIVAYYALSTGQILASETLGAMRHMPGHIPAVLLGRLAADRAWNGHGLGRALLADAVQRLQRAATEVAARLIVVQAISSAAEAFCLRHGFARLPVATPTLALDLVKLQKLAPF